MKFSQKLQVEKTFQEHVHNNFQTEFALKIKQLGINEDISKAKLTFPKLNFSFSSELNNENIEVKEFTKEVKSFLDMFSGLLDNFLSPIDVDHQRIQEMAALLDENIYLESKSLQLVV